MNTLKNAEEISTGCGRHFRHRLPIIYSQ